jgi:maltose alpha-D-glucosyltransferase / alpha-amylase
VFRPEPISTLYQRSLYQSLRSSLRQNLGIAARRELGPGIREAVDALLETEDDILRSLHRIVAQRMSGVRIRCHGDYRLDEVLFTGTDYVLFDFAGDATRPLSERRIKAPPARDLAEMLRSYDYATRAAMQAEVDAGAIPDEAVAVFDRWGRTWYRWIGAAFLRSYCEAGGARLLPASLDDVQALLDAYALEKASRELLWEIDHRPNWAFIPLAAMHAAVEVERART